MLRNSPIRCVMLYSGHLQNSLKAKKVRGNSSCTVSVMMYSVLHPFVLYLLSDYRLVVICSKEDEDKSHIISRLHTFRRPVVPSLDENECRKYLEAHFTLPTELDLPQVLHTEYSAAVVDPDKLATLVLL